MKNLFLLLVISLFSFSASAATLSDKEVVNKCRNYANSLYHAFLTAGSEEYKAYTDVELMVEYKFSTTQKNRDECLQQLKKFATK